MPLAQLPLFVHQARNVVADHPRSQSPYIPAGKGRLGGVRWVTFSVVILTHLLPNQDPFCQANTLKENRHVKFTFLITSQTTQRENETEKSRGCFSNPQMTQTSPSCTHMCTHTHQLCLFLSHTQTHGFSHTHSLSLAPSLSHTHTHSTNPPLFH